jgi:ElaB/YqjD/DUF883 family membrane-anchored ribosome-binding protein
MDETLRPGGLFEDQTDQTKKDELTSRAGDVARRGVEEAQRLGATARDRLYREVDSRKQTLADKLEEIAGDLEGMGRKGAASGALDPSLGLVDEEEEDVQRRIVTGAARKLRTASRTLADHTTDELVARAGRKVRERPGMFLAACAAVGFIGGRLLRR